MECSVCIPCVNSGLLEKSRVGFSRSDLQCSCLRKQRNIAVVAAVCKFVVVLSVEVRVHLPQQILNPWMLCARTESVFRFLCEENERSALCCVDIHWIREYVLALCSDNSVYTQCGMSVEKWCALTTNLNCANVCLRIERSLRSISCVRKRTC